MATISPVRTLSTTPAAAMRLEFRARGDQFVAQRVLHAQIDGKLHRSLQPVGGKPRHVQPASPCPSSHFSMPAMP